ncbi:MAG: TMEM165/GDT1 family protein [Acidimicrobiia bacterium]
MAATAVIGSFGVIALAEWGDFTQLATASLAATSTQPMATGVGARRVVCRRSPQSGQ